MFAAAQLCSQLSPTQLNALAAAYHQQQQQIQRSSGSTIGSLNYGHTSNLSFTQALAAVTSTTKSLSNVSSMGGVHGTNFNSRLTQAPSTHLYNQKRSPSIQSQFHSGYHINQTASNTSLCKYFV